MSKPSVMELHGTEAGGLTVGSILGAAKEDLERRARNIGRSSGCELYAFHRDHILKATKKPKAEQPSWDPLARLLEQAITNRHMGAESGKRGTRLIYKDETLLRQALEKIVNPC